MPTRGARLASLLLAIFLIRADDGKTHLVFSHKIGMDWKDVAGEWMNFVAISPDGATVASNGAIPGRPAGDLGLWTFPDGKYIRRIAGRARAFSPDWRFLATGDGFLDLKSNHQVSQLSRIYGLLAETAFSPDGQYLVFTVYGPTKKAGAGKIIVVRTTDGSLLRTFGKRYTAALAILPDNKTIASGHWDNVTLWDLVSGQRIALLERFGRHVCGIGFSKDGRYLAAGTDDGQVQIWDLTARKCMHSLRIGYGDVSNPSFSPDGKLVAAGTYAEGTVSLVAVSSGVILSQTKVSMFGCGSVAFSPDGKYLITPSNGGQIGPKQFDLGGTIRVFQVSY